MVNAEKEVLKRIAQDDKKVLDTLYKEYRDPFLNYFKRYAISDDEIRDLYQETMIAFYQNGVRGKLKGLSSSIKTYVFGIGKYKAIDMIRRKTKELDPPKISDDYVAIDLGEEDLTPEQKKLKKYFAQLGESCQKMLTMFYYRGLDISDIVSIGGYKDSNSVKSHKSRCVKQLRTLVNKKHG